MAHLVQRPEIEDALRGVRTIALLGANPRPDRPAHYVPAYMARKGYRILPVNPVHVGKELFGEPVRATLAELDGPVDMVNVFRRPDVLPTHLDDLLAMAPRPALVWLQQGIRNDAFADELVAAGIDVVQDRCLMVDHRRWGL